MYARVLLFTKAGKKLPLALGDLVHNDLRATRRGSFAIIDHEAIAKVAAWLSQQRGHSWATSDIGGLQPTLSRLQNRGDPHPAITRETFGRLHRRVLAAGRRDLEQLLFRAVLRPEAMDALMEHSAWINRERGRSEKFAGPLGLLKYLGFNTASDESPDSPKMAQKAIEEHLLILTQHVVIEAAFRDPENRRIGRKFVDEALAQQHAIARVELALLRVVDPMVRGAFDPSGVERNLDDLLGSPIELRALLKAGFVRERIMLNRQTHFARLQEVYPAGGRWENDPPGDG
jgi:hypothetical protein